MLRNLSNRNKEKGSHKHIQTPDNISGIVIKDSPRWKIFVKIIAQHKTIVLLAFVVGFLSYNYLLNFDIGMWEKSKIFSTIEKDYSNLSYVDSVEESKSDDKSDLNYKPANTEQTTSSVDDIEGYSQTDSTDQLTPINETSESAIKQEVLVLHDPAPIEIMIDDETIVNGSQSSQVNDVQEVHKVEVQLSNEELAGQEYIKAINAVKNGRKIQAEKFLRKAIDYSPDHMGSLEALSALLISVGRYEDADIVIDQGLEIAAEHPLLLQLKARVLLSGGLIDEATILLEKYKPSISVYTEYYALLAVIYQKQKKYKESAQLYQELLSIKPQNGIWDMGLAIALESLGNKKEALLHYNLALNSGDLKGAGLSFVSNKLRVLSEKTSRF